MQHDGANEYLAIFYSLYLAARGIEASGTNTSHHAVIMNSSERRLD